MILAVLIRYVFFHFLLTLFWSVGLVVIFIYQGTEYVILAQKNVFVNSVAGAMKNILITLLLL